MINLDLALLRQPESGLLPEKDEWLIKQVMLGEAANLPSLADVRSHSEYYTAVCLELLRLGRSSL